MKNKNLFAFFIVLMLCLVCSCLCVGKKNNFQVIKEVKVPFGFRIARGAIAETYTGTGWASTIVDNETGIIFVYIPAGSFMMGSPNNEKGCLPSQPSHRVKISKGFYMGAYEITQGQWAMIMGTNPSVQKGMYYPVSNINWYECHNFCEKMKKNMRLPTEAEWEYACRAGTIESCYEKLDKIAWYKDNSEGKLHIVGQKAGNKWGLYDMLGNVSEWCYDCKDNFSSLYVENNTSGASCKERIARGGAFCTLLPRVTLRLGYLPTEKNEAVGFRVVLEIP